MSLRRKERERENLRRGLVADRLEIFDLVQKRVATRIAYGERRRDGQDVPSCSGPDCFICGHNEFTEIDHDGDIVCHGHDDRSVDSFRERRVYWTIDSRWIGAMNERETILRMIDNAIEGAEPVGDTFDRLMRLRHLVSVRSQQ